MSTPPVQNRSGPVGIPANSITRAEMAKAELFLPDQFQDLKAWISVIIIILGWCAITLEVFVRRDFGERYFNVLRLFFAYMVLSIFAIFGRGGLDPLLFWLFGVAFFLEPI